MTTIKVEITVQDGYNQYTSTIGPFETDTVSLTGLGILFDGKVQEALEQANVEKSA